MKALFSLFCLAFGDANQSCKVGEYNDSSGQYTGEVRWNYLSEKTGLISLYDSAYFCLVDENFLDENISEVDICQSINLFMDPSSITIEQGEAVYVINDGQDRKIQLGSWSSSKFSTIVWGTEGTSPNWDLLLALNSIPNVNEKSDTINDVTMQLVATCRSFDPCAEVDCSSNGVCEIDGTSYICICSSGYAGNDCSERVMQQENICENSIFGIECQDNFKVKINVLDANCFSQRFPTLSLSDLVVRASNQNDVTASNTCKAFTGSESGNNFIYGDEDLTAPVTSTSNSLFFDGNVCSADAKFDGDILLYTAKLTTYIHDDEVNMLLNPIMTDVDFKCKYKPTVGVPIAVSSVILDQFEVDGGTKVDDADISSLVITPTVSVQQQDGSFASVTDSVALGSRVKVTFTSSANVDIHIGNCVGQNSQENSTHTLPLVVDDCFVTSNSGALSHINPTSGESVCGADHNSLCKTELIMNQFAFIGQNSEDASNLDLVFYLKCSIEMGTTNCNNSLKLDFNGRRHRSSNSRQMIDLSYSVNASAYTVDNGIVHGLEVYSSALKMASFTVLTNLLFFM